MEAIGAGTAEAAAPTSECTRIFDRQRGPYSFIMSDRHARWYLPNDVEVLSISSASSGETASDIPGPGRLLDKAYSFLGRRIERGLTSLAIRRGHGPENVSLRIRRREELYHDPVLWGYKRDYSKNDRDEQLKDVKKLIRYTRLAIALLWRISTNRPDRSKSEATRKEALDRIVDLTINNPYLLEMLKSLDTANILRSEEPFLWDYCDTSLHISSRLALACAQEEEAYKLVVETRQHGQYNGKELSEFVRCV